MITTKIGDDLKSVADVLFTTAVSTVIMAFIVISIAGSYATAVTINGERVGFVENKEELATLIADVEDDLSDENHGADIEIDEETIELEYFAKPKDEVQMLNENQLEDELLDADTVTADAGIIYIDEEPVLYLGSADDANFILEALKQNYTVDGEDVFYEFVENVRVGEGITDLANLVSTESALTYLTAESRANVEVTATVSENEVTEYETEEVETDELYSGEIQVKSEGKDGETLVTSRAVYINGKETESEFIEDRVIIEPENEVVLVGTGQNPYYGDVGDVYIGGDGSLNDPMKNLEISSDYGQRDGRLHAGTDFRNPEGTSIYAADSGTVTYSGWQNGYGNIIEISHDNGMTTLYAHCSKLYMRVGDEVSRGQPIAAVGSTGRSTGNHLHFEVRIDGTPVDPMNYLLNR